MSEMDWMYDSLTERFGENLGERQRVVDALLIAKAIVGPGPLGSSNIEGTLSIARFILDEWDKYSDAEDAEDSSPTPEFKGDRIQKTDWDLIRTGQVSPPSGVWFSTSGGQEVKVNPGFLERRDGTVFVPGQFAFPLKRKKD